MFLNAITIGDAIPRADFDAAVHSVFRSAVNISLANNITLLTLVASSEADLPQGIRVDTPEDFSFESGALCIGDSATCHDGFLRLGSLTIDLRGARRWKCDLPSLQADPSNPSVATAWRCAWDALNTRQIQLNAEIIAWDLFRSDSTLRAGAAMRGLLEATQRFDSTAASSLNALIGLGSGLTPSGDDLLVGYLAGLWCAVLDKSERVQFASDLGKEVIRLSGQTTDISRAYLYHAARGQVSSRLADLAEAICRGENLNRLLAIIESAMQVGHTSGMDAVTGLLVGLVAWNSPSDTWV
ncbi:MAG: DUF2877 domain-containing protein [Chloroflexi bacterium]|nr:DUF2877 domain-containing protein [Chloroflexota bacterium]